MILRGAISRMAPLNDTNSKFINVTAIILKHRIFSDTQINILRIKNFTFDKTFSILKFYK